LQLAAETIHFPVFPYLNNKKKKLAAVTKPKPTSATNLKASLAICYSLPEKVLWGTNVVVIENEAEAGAFSEASEKASFERVMVGIVWDGGFAFHFCSEQRESD
jgi:hypothetical protein